MRELVVSDVFKLAGIIRKTGIRSQLLTVPKPEGEDYSGYGMEMLLVLFENIDKAEDEIYTFFADLKGITPEEFKNMGLDELGLFIQELRSLEGIGNFFQSAFKMEIVSSKTSS